MATHSARALAVFISACALCIACNKGNENARSDSAAGTAVPATPDTAAKVAAAAPLTDANIGALLDEANAADSAAGHIAKQKAANASVKEFGVIMMRDHHVLRKSGQELAKKLSLTPLAPAGDTLESAAKKWNDSLNAMPKGPMWDKSYIDHEVMVHQSVEQLLQTADAAAQNAELKKAIESAQPMIDGHLKKAQDLQNKLGSVATNPAAAPATTPMDTGMAKKKAATSKKKY